jgi:ABC-type glycerol-3-phosphate transport system substrate-binding protein
MSNLRHIASLLLISAMLTACGGGGSSAAQSDQITTPTVIDDPSSNPEVDPPATVAHATVAWSAPTLREDGSAFTQEEIAHYEVYHIEDASGAMDVIEVDADATEYRLALAAGSHELGVAVVDVNGATSQMSELQTIEID